MPRTTNRKQNRQRGRPRRPSAGKPSVAQEKPPVAERDLQTAPAVEASGVLEFHPRGYGFLRSVENDLHALPDDVFVPKPLIDKFKLKPGLMVHGIAKQVRSGEGAKLHEVFDVEGLPPERYQAVRDFEALTPINPEEQLHLETGPQPVTTRVIDLLTPLGKGQRALIVAPPRSGKTVLLQHIGQAIASNHPGVDLNVLLIDERPEEVTDMRRRITGNVFASSLDRDVENHVRLSRLVIERCKRQAEMGKDVFLMVDSITRMARAFNKWVGDSGRTMSGGIDVKALDIPKRFFAGARAFDEGGSLTIVATALIDTGSRMDELIFQEFKGTGNMELVLDRQLADRRVWPAIDVSQSGTRREEKLLDPATLQVATLLRRTLSTMHPVDAMQRLTGRLAKVETNQKLVEAVFGSSSISV